MKSADSLERIARKVEATFARRSIRLTLGGEPTYVPVDPVGSEWSITALGPTKLKYGYGLAQALIAETVPHALAILSPGKLYPGEINPRWVINLIWRADGQPMVTLNHGERRRGITTRSFAMFRTALIHQLGISRRKWLRATDSAEPQRPIWVLPLDHSARGFHSDAWKLGPRFELLAAEGSAGLRLPLAALPQAVSRRALVVEVKEQHLHIFLPPLLQKPFLKLLTHLATALDVAGLPPPKFEGYIPQDDAGLWQQLAIAADPGVLEVNLPPCATWREYQEWSVALQRACAVSDLRSYKQLSTEDETGTGGGNHLLFGGPTLEQNPLFTRPRWLTSLLRYWQHHPSLSYLFTGCYVGSSSQAPRPDEGASALYDLEVAYQFLEKLPRGDHRHLIGETLRHLHTDSSGNTHRSEVSFDKFWNVAFDGGCRGLVEFRALESLPRAEWMAAVALLWRTLAAHLLVHPFSKPLIDHADRLHDFYFLPSCLWSDFEQVLRDLSRSGFALGRDVYREIFGWRFPLMLTWKNDGASLQIRKAHESWPLLCETPLEGGHTSRFVDTSIERLEFLANTAFVSTCTIRVQGRRLELQRFPRNRSGCGLRYRRTALNPSLHPGIAPHMPLFVSIQHPLGVADYQLEADRRRFAPCPANRRGTWSNQKPCKKLHDGLLTCDLRLP